MTYRAYRLSKVSFIPYRTAESKVITIAVAIIIVLPPVFIGVIGSFLFPAKGWRFGGQFSTTLTRCQLATVDGTTALIRSARPSHSSAVRLELI
jgi:hypothetical protein